MELCSKNVFKPIRHYLLLGKEFFKTNCILLLGLSVGIFDYNCILLLYLWTTIHGRIFVVSCTKTRCKAQFLAILLSTLLDNEQSTISFNTGFWRISSSTCLHPLLCFKVKFHSLLNQSFLLDTQTTCHFAGF